jgi:hypothetical protein
MLHVLNGDSPAGTLRQSGVSGDIAVWPDVLTDGPIPAHADDETWRAVRARFLADSFRLAFEDALRLYERADAAIGRFRDYDEVVLWFEHDLFDQLLLLRHLDWFGRQSLGATRLSLICIGEFPGVQPFHGLGQLSAPQLRSLIGTRQPVTIEQTMLGRRAWAAFVGDDPTQIEQLLAEDTSALPFLAGALRRHLEEFPDTKTGLPRTERQILDLLAQAQAQAGGAATAPMTPAALFRASQQLEERVYMGDWSFWLRVRALAGGGAGSQQQPQTPALIALDVEDARGPNLPQGSVALTDVGRAVLRGQEDWIRLAGFDRWLGGVHLTAPPGGRVRWHWDRDAGQLRAG